MPGTQTVNPGLFPTTLWSAVMGAAHCDESTALTALERLARSYWQPLYVFVRQRGADHHGACDSVQGFFQHLLSREVLHGVQQRETRFRTFLLACFSNWLSNHRRDGNALRRGGGVMLLPMEEALRAEERSFCLDGSEEHSYDRRWARAVFDHARARLDEEIETRGGRREFFEALRSRLFGAASARPEWDVVAEIFGMNVGTVRKAAHDLRQRFAELLRHEVRKVVGSDAEVDDELRHLARLLARDETEHSV